MRTADRVRELAAQHSVTMEESGVHAFAVALNRLAGASGDETLTLIALLGEHGILTDRQMSDLIAAHHWDRTAKDGQ